MSTSVSWPPIGGTSYSVPATSEVNWQALSNLLIALGTNAQSVANTKFAIRVALTTPVTVASATDCVVLTDLSSPGAVTVNLPAGITGQIFCIVDGKGDAASNNITIDPNGAEQINGASTYVINKNRAGVIIGFNGTSWTVLAEFTNVAAGTIPRSSIAAGSANQVVINDGSGNLSSEATLAKSRGGTGADNSSVTFPSTGTITTNAGSATLTNKTIDGDDNTVQDLPITALKTNVAYANQALVFDGSGVPTTAATLTNPMTTAGDIIIGGVSGAPARLAVGTSVQYLGVSAGAPAWTGGPASRVFVHTGNGRGATATRRRRFTTAYENTGTAITYADSANNGGTFTINANGLYAINYQDQGSAQWTFAISRNSNGTTNPGALTVGTNRLANGVSAAGFIGQLSTLYYLASGDVVEAITDTAADGTGTDVSFQIVLVWAL